MKIIKTFFPDHFSQADLNGVVTGLMISILAFILLTNAKAPMSKRTNKIIAQLESFSNNVRYKESGSVSFYDVLKNEELQNSDEIFTGEDSTATVQFINSKTKLKIPSSSLVKIEEGEDGEMINVKNGVVDIVLGKNKTINLKSNGVIHQIKSSLKDSTVRAYYGAGELHLFTKDGGIKITNANAENELLSNQDSTLVGGKLSKKSHFSILSPTPGEKLESTDGIKIFVSQNAQYLVSLSKHADFSPPTYTTQFKGSSLNWKETLEEGDYFLKITDKDNSQVVPVSLTSKYNIEGLSPSDGELINISPGEEIKLSWKALPVKSYKVTVLDSHKNEKFFITHTNHLTLNNPTGSNIEWSVSPEIGDKKYSILKKSNLVVLKFNGEIKFLGLPQNTIYNIEDIKTNLKWTTPKGEQFSLKILDLKTNKYIVEKELSKRSFFLPFSSIGSYKVEVSSIDYPSLQKAEFKYDVYSPLLTWDTRLPKEIKSIEDNVDFSLKYRENFNFGKNVKLNVNYTPTNGKTIKRNIEFMMDENIKLEGFGQYCFRAQLKYPVEFYSDSRNYCLKLIQTPVFPHVPKAKDSVLTYSKHDGLDSYEIKVPTLDKAVKYHFEIFRDIHGKKIVYSADSKTPEIFWTTNRAGIYYLKYKVYDAKNRESPFSPFSKLIFPISPLTNWQPEE